MNAFKHIFKDLSQNWTKTLHFKILEIHFLEIRQKSGKIFWAAPEPEPDIEAGYPAGTGFSRISGRFLVVVGFFFTELKHFQGVRAGIWGGVKPPVNPSDVHYDSHYNNK